MLALTVKQPYASLIVLGHKPVENRSWRADVGPLLIHAGLKTDAAGFEFARSLGIELDDELPRGGIIGRVRLVDCVKNSDSPWAEAGQWHWLLVDPEPLELVPMRGRLGLFDVRERSRTHGGE